MKRISIITNLFVCLAVALMSQSCKDNENNNIDSSALTLLSYTPEQGGNVATEGVIELTFSKAVRQAPDTEITINGKAIRVIITDNVVRANYSEPLADHVTLDIPEGALTDMNSVQKYEGLNLKYEIKLEKRLYDAVVDKNGNGDYITVQEAIDAAPSELDKPYLIFITNGEYEEYVMIPKKKNFIHLIGQDKDKTIIKYKVTVSKENVTDKYPENPWDYSYLNPANNMSSEQCAVMVIFGNDFYAENLTLENTWGTENQSGPQADALCTRVDRIAFFNCKLLSFQDTWWVRQATNDISARNYADNCWIEGAVDYVYGSANLLVENSTLYNVRAGSVLTAGSQYEGTPWGHVFKDCIMDGNDAAKSQGNFFGRPWRNAPKELFINVDCRIPMDPAGWQDMNTSPGLFAVYNVTDKDGQPLSTEQWKRDYTFKDESREEVTVHYDGKFELTADEAAKYTYENIITSPDGWNPKAFYTSEKLPAVENINLYGTTLSWDGMNKAICYLVFDNGEFIGQTTETTMEVDVNGENYTVKAVNKYGSLSD